VIRTLFSPAVALMDRLRYPRKMLVVAAAFSLPIGVFLFLDLAQIHGNIEKARQERMGAEYNRLVIGLFRHVQEHRGLADAYLRGDSSFRDMVMTKRADIDEDLKVIARFGAPPFGTAETSRLWAAIRAGWADLGEETLSLTPEESFEKHTALIGKILSYLNHVADLTGLTLDDRLDRHYLMETAVSTLPLALEYMGRLRGYGAGAIASGDLSPEERARLRVLSDITGSTLEKVGSNLQKAFEANPGLSGLEEDLGDALDPMEGALRLVRGEMVDGDRPALSAEEYFTALTDAMGAGFALHAEVTEALSELLDAHVDGLFRRQTAMAAFAFLSLALLAYLSAGIYFSTTGSLEALLGASRSMSRGDHRVRVSIRARDETREVAQSFNEMAEALTREIQGHREAEEDLRRSNAELEQFASVASHDLKEPILAVASDLRLLGKRLEGRLEGEAGELLSDANQEILRMETLIRDLLTYARVGTRGGGFEEVQSATALRHAMGNLRVRLQERHAEVALGELPSVVADPMQLTQLFQNLLSNAVKYVEKGRRPHVRVGAERRGEEWVFSVRDNGIGIAETDQERIFKVFTRLRKEYAGTGIGLATCKKIVERHGGRIWVESKPGEGSTFSFTLPVREAPGPAKEAAGTGS
jgi:signal transduction histidine kinase